MQGNKKKKKFTYITLLQILTIVGLLAYMQIAVTSGQISRIFMAAPSDIVKRGVDTITDGTLFPHLLLTLEEVLTGYLLAAVTGIAVSILWVLFPKLEAYMNLFCSAIMAVPKTAILPLLILWFGIGFKSKVVLIFLFGVFTVLYNALTGVVFAEIQSAKAGLGFLLSESQNNLDTARMFFLIILVTLISVGFVKIIGEIEYITCHKWRKV